MKYTVVWNKKAQNSLATLWMSAPDRNEVASAADRIDRLLAVDPEHAGESRDVGARILIDPPLAVRFEIFEADRKVRVFSLWRWGKKP